MSPVDLDAIRRELATIDDLDRLAADPLGSLLCRHMPALLDEIEQLRIERDDNRAEIAELQQRLARADTIPWRPVPDARIADLTSNEVVGVAFDSRTGHYWQHQRGMRLPNCNNCGLWMTDWSLINDCDVATVERLRGGAR